MATTQIDGGKQIRAGTVTNTEIASGAAIADTKLATSYVKADGTRAFTGNQALGGFKFTGTADASADTDVPSWGQVKALNTGRDWKDEVDIATTTAGTLASSFENGDTVDGVVLVTGWRILIKDQAAPAENGIYVVPVSGAPTRATDADSTAEVTAGMSVPVVRGTLNSGTVWMLTTTGAITLNTTGLTFVSTGESITVDSSIVKTGHQLGRAALTGDVTASAGSNATTIANNAVSFAKMADIATDTLVGRDTAGTGDPEAISVSGGLEFTGAAGIQRSALTGDVTATAGSNGTTIANSAVTLAKMANLAANSVIANNTGSGAVPAALGLTAAATASTAVVRDANANARFNSVIGNFQTVTSAAGTTTLLVSSPQVTQITGSTIQTVVMPDATTLVIGQSFTVTNRSSGVVTVNMNGGSLLQTMAPGSFLTATVVTIGTAAGTWDAAYTPVAGAGTVTTVSVVTANGFAGTVATATSTPAITLTSSITGVLKGNGTAISAASNTAGADYVNATNFITRETPSGTVNGSTTAFGLANTPISGSEQVYLNGILQEPGAGNDYTISGATITYLTAPLTGDKLRVSYLK